MPDVKIPIGPVNQNSDQSALSQESYSILDGYIGQNGELIRRPGLLTSSDTWMFTYNSGNTSGLPLLGLYWWPHAQAVVGKAPISLWFMSWAVGANPTVDTMVGADTVSAYGVTPRASFAGASDYCYVASGNKIQRVSPTGVASSIVDVDTPANVTHVGLLDGYLLATTWNSSSFYWSDANNPSSWTATNFASAVGDSDYNTAMHIINRQIYFFGPASIEIWENNGITPFERIPGGFIQTGTCSPYTILEVDGTFFFFDHRRRFVKMSGRGVDPVYCPYQKAIQQASKVDDAYSYRMSCGGYELLVFHFPSIQRTFVFNLSNQTWSEWGEWNEGSSTYGQFPVSAYCYAVDRSRGIGCNRLASDFIFIDPDFYYDGSYASRTSIRTSWVSGQIDHGTTRQKRCQEIRFRVKRGTSVSSEAKMMIRWRDNNRPQWSNWHELTLGDTGESDIICVFRRLGIYRTRQWEFACSDKVPFVLSDISEEVDFLR